MSEFYKEKRYNNFREIVNDAAAMYGNKAAFTLRVRGDNMRNISYNDLKEYYYKLCTKFIEDGFLGKRIAVRGKNSFEWILSYLAAATVGIVVPLDKELEKADVLEFIKAGECEAACFADPEILDGVDIKIYSCQDIMRVCDSDIVPVTAQIDAIEFPKDEMQVLIFTSGTTGSSKGVCLSQWNICSDIFSTVTVVKITTEDVTLSMLPLHHTYECTLDHLLLLSKGATITYMDNLQAVTRNLQEYKPTILVVVPLMLKFFSKRIKKAIVDGLPERYKPCFEDSTIAEGMKKLPLPLRIILKQKVRKNLGGRLRLFIVGAAEVEVSLIEDFNALGIRTLQGYGLTECSPLIVGNSDFIMNPASTGVAMPGVEIMIENPNEEGVGEILAKGDNIMLGYYKDEEATKKVFRGGWFHTGDLGVLDSEGFLYIKGRLKNVIVTENGKNIYPEELETRLSERPELSESIVIQAINKGVVAVKAKILPNKEYIKEVLGRVPTAEECAEFVQKAVAEVNAAIPHYKHITIIETLTKELEKTTTMKIRRFGKNADEEETPVAPIAAEAATAEASSDETAADTPAEELSEAAAEE